MAVIGVSLCMTAGDVGTLRPRTGLARILDVLPKDPARQASAIADRRLAFGVVGVGFGVFFVIAAILKLVAGAP